ncbi:hypothetical protein VP01_270g4 [Puccinia sorghi]|uniref:Uncharacterized protein n=1 Tax=Puccinia sorghi TaxID=27349 RepID=A0A0L6V3J8_9BASI|nr:hypothetical protein VP01_270g4 [Puccinia sorghi]
MGCHLQENIEFLRDMKQDYKYIPPSIKTEDGYVKLAKEAYYSKVKNVFTLHHCWNVVQEH